VLTTQHPSSHKSWHVAVAQSVYFACGLKATEVFFLFVLNCGRETILGPLLSAGTTEAPRFSSICATTVAQSLQRRAGKDIKEAV
jgi:hypothetical protein